MHDIKQLVFLDGGHALDVLRDGQVAPVHVGIKDGEALPLAERAEEIKACAALDIGVGVAVEAASLLGELDEAHVTRDARSLPERADGGGGNVAHFLLCGVFPRGRPRLIAVAEELCPVGVFVVKNGVHTDQLERRLGHKARSESLALKTHLDLKVFVLPRRDDGPFAVNNAPDPETRYLHLQPSCVCFLIKGNVDWFIFLS